MWNDEKIVRCSFGLENLPKGTISKNSEDAIRLSHSFVLDDGGRHPIWTYRAPQLLLSGPLPNCVSFPRQRLLGKYYFKASSGAIPFLRAIPMRNFRVWRIVMRFFSIAWNLSTAIRLSGRLTWTQAIDRIISLLWAHIARINIGTDQPNNQLEKSGCRENMQSIELGTSWL